MPHFNPTEMIIVLIIVLILFGAGRIGRVGGELGTAIREFRKGLNPDSSGDKSQVSNEAQDK